MFDPSQVRSFVKDVKKEMGPAWSLIGERFQRALIAERAIYIMSGQASETVTPDEISDLHFAMLKEAGLES